MKAVRGIRKLFLPALEALWKPHINKMSTQGDKGPSFVFLPPLLAQPAERTEPFFASYSLTNERWVTEKTVLELHDLNMFCNL